MRAVDRLMAARRPAGAPGEKSGVALNANRDLVIGMFLEMALETEVRVARRQHLVVDRTVGLVAFGTTFTDRLVLKGIRPALRVVTVQADIVLRRQRRAPAQNGIPLVHLMAIAAANLPFDHRVPVGEPELPLLVQVALKASLGITARIHNRLKRPAGVGMDAARAMARLATGIDAFMVFQPRMRRTFEPVGDRIVTIRACLGSDKSGPGYLRRCHNHAVNRMDAGDTHNRRSKSHQRKLYKSPPAKKTPKRMC